MLQLTYSPFPLNLHFYVSGVCVRKYKHNRKSQNPLFVTLTLSDVKNLYVEWCVDETRVYVASGPANIKLALEQSFNVRLPLEFLAFAVARMTIYLQKFIKRTEYLRDSLNAVQKRNLDIRTIQTKIGTKYSSKFAWLLSKRADVNFGLNMVSVLSVILSIKMHLLPGKHALRYAFQKSNSPSRTNFTPCAHLWRSRCRCNVRGFGGIL